jgi:hypothetical protein
MSYGFEVLTSAGVKNTFGLNTARAVRIYNATTLSGSASIPEFNSNNGDYIFLMVTYAVNQQVLVWNNTTKTISWSKHSNSFPDSGYSSNFSIIFFHYK